MASIYLAGPIDNVEGDEWASSMSRAWPSLATAALNEMGVHLTFTPHYAFGAKPTSHPETLKKINFEAIKACDAVLAGVFPEVVSWGTPMEIGYAEQLGKPVVLWKDDKLKGELPAYLKHLPCYGQIPEACRALVGLVKEYKSVESGPVLLTNNTGAIDEPKMEGDAGYDIRSHIPLVLHPGEWRRIPCGFGNSDLRIAVPPGYWASPMARSSYAERGLLVQPTVIEQYRGPIFVFGRNVGLDPIHIEAGDRIAQLVFFPLCRFPLEERLELPGSERGNNGFGSTGRK